MLKSLLTSVLLSMTMTAGCASLKSSPGGGGNADLMTPAAMLSVYEVCEAALRDRDPDAFMATIHPDAIVENVTLGTRSVGKMEIRKRVERELAGVRPLPQERRLRLTANTGLASCLRER